MMQPERQPIIPRTQAEYEKRYKELLDAGMTQAAAALQQYWRFWKE